MSIQSQTTFTEKINNGAIYYFRRSTEHKSFNIFSQIQLSLSFHQIRAKNYRANR